MRAEQGLLVLLFLYLGAACACVHGAPELRHSVYTRPGEGASARNVCVARSSEGLDSVPTVYHCGSQGLW